MRHFILTGGAAVGKSLVCKFLSDLNASIIDTDDINRKLLTNSCVIRKIVSIIGNKCLNNDSSLDKKIIRDIIFNDASKKQELENLLHPLIQKYALQKAQLISLQYVNINYILYVVPLFLGKNQEFWRSQSITSIAVVSSNDLRLNRLINRGLDAKIAKQIIQSQPSNENYAQSCEYIIENNSNKKDLHYEVNKIHTLLNKIY